MERSVLLSRTNARSIAPELEPATALMPWDSASAFLVKSLLYPVASVVSLALSMLICGEPYRKAYFLTAVLAFLATSDLLSVAPLKVISAKGASARSFSSIACRWFMVVALLWELMTISGLQTNFSSRVWLTWALITPPVLWFSAIGARSGFGLAASGRRVRTRNAIIVGLNDLSRQLAKRLSEDQSPRVCVLGFFDDRASLTEGADALLGDTSELHRFIRSNDVGIVYITWPMTGEQRIFDLIDILRDSTASIYFVPDVSIMNVIQGRVALVNGMPVVGVCESPFYGLRGLQKRALDVVLSALLILIGLPVLVGIAIGVRLSSPGPVLFTQRRYGLDGREFRVYKFRSMHVTEDGSTNFSAAKRNDARVTRFGAFIRRMSLDELPQLFNVLEGSMSLVGPRPHVVSMNEAYRRLISGYMIRHKVRPGITGWAQVNGSRGGNDLDSMRRRLAFDLEYVKHWSLRLDLMILVKTLTLFWKDHRAF
ncbi:MAG: undecaprenyl-phosphate glucose phosphotransferase [Gammaproteobacteria bacterium]